MVTLGPPALQHLGRRPASRLHLTPSAPARSHTRVRVAAHPRQRCLRAQPSAPPVPLRQPGTTPWTGTAPATQTIQRQTQAEHDLTGTPSPASPRDHACFTPRPQCPPRGRSCVREVAAYIRGIAWRGSPSADRCAEPQEPCESRGRGVGGRNSGRFPCWRLGVGQQCHIQPEGEASLPGGWCLVGAGIVGSPLPESGRHHRRPRARARPLIVARAGHRLHVGQRRRVALAVPRGRLQQTHPGSDHPDHLQCRKQYAPRPRSCRRLVTGRTDRHRCTGHLEPCAPERRLRRCPRRPPASGLRCGDTLDDTGRGHCPLGILGSGRRRIPGIPTAVGTPVRQP